MYTLRRMAATTAALLFAASAAAQPRTATIGKEVPDVKISLQGERDTEERYLFRELRGSIALFYFWRSTNLESLQRLSMMQQLHDKYRTKGVCFISVTLDQNEKVQEVKRERNLDFFRWEAWGGQAMHYLLGAFSEPYVVLVDPRGILAWRGLPSDRLEERLADLIARTNPPVGNPDWLDRRFRKAERFCDQREFGRGFTIARELVKMTEESHTVHGRAATLMARCEAGAEEQLGEALQAEAAKDYEKAARIVAEIAVRFEDPDEEEDDRGGRDDREDSVKRKAEYEIGRMNAKREFKQLIRDARQNAEGELLNDRAAGLEEDEYFVEAKHIYERTVKEYEDTAAAKEAKRRLRRIREDTGIQKKIAERRARDEAIRWLDLADRFAAIKLYDEAREHYEKVIAQHPNTEFASQAKQRLSELPKAATGEKASADARQAEMGSKP